MRRAGLLVLLFAAGCGSGTSTTGTPAAPSPAVPATSPAPSLPTVATAADLTFCVSLTNHYRASVNVPAVREDSSLEAFAATGAQQDGSSHTAHGHVTAQPLSGTWGENELPWWPLSASVQDTITTGLAQMWAEGPSGGHYQNLANRAFSRLGCGVSVNSKLGEITVVQDFQ